MIAPSIIQGLSQQMVQARLNAIDAKPFLFGTHFPLRKINGFDWKTLTNQLEKGNIAADIHTDNGTIIRKRRPRFERASGDLPHIAISRERSRSEMKEYQTALAFAQDSDASKLVQYWGEDVDFTFNGVQSELEYIAWALASNAGKLDFTIANNATFANEHSLDYAVADEQKETVSTSWDNKTADILGDLAKIVKKAKDMGMNPKVAFISLNEFYRISSNEQIMKANAGLAQTSAGIYTPADLASVNSVLARQAWLNGIQLKVIDQSVTREAQDGTRTTENPFADHRIVLAESEILGSTQYDILQIQSNSAIRAERSHTVITKFYEDERSEEITKGEADAMPVFDTAWRNFYVRTDGSTW